MSQMINANIIREQVANGNLNRALELFYQCLQGHSNADCMDLYTQLSARNNNNEKEYNLGILRRDDYLMERAKITKVLLDELNTCCGKTSAASNKETVSTWQSESTTSASVFISYSRKDSAFAEKLKKGLLEAHIRVVMDVDELKAGENISEFIERAIRETDMTLTIISTNSLLSDWVGLETIQTLLFERVLQQQKFIACYTDDVIFQNDIMLQLVEKIEERIQDRQKIMHQLQMKFLPTSSFSFEINRLINLRNNLDNILIQLRERLSMDIRELTFEQSFEKILHALNQKKAASH